MICHPSVGGDFVQMEDFHEVWQVKASSLCDTFGHQVKSFGAFFDTSPRLLAAMAGGSTTHSGRNPGPGEPVPAPGGRYGEELRPSSGRASEADAQIAVL